MTGKFLLLLLTCACADLAASHAHHPTKLPVSGDLSIPTTERTPSENEKGTQGIELKANVLERKEDGFEPETVLSVHYDRGLIKELYLSQTRGELTGNNVWKPSVSQRKRICLDLCKAGLGGDPCGYSCQAVTPDIVENINQADLELISTTSNATEKPSSSNGTKKYHQSGKNTDKDSPATTIKAKVAPSTISAVRRLVIDAIQRSKESSEEVTTVESAEETERVAGVPRSEVCPTLCLNGLGNPLCSCNSAVQHPSWSSVCDVFCSADSSYQLAGCPVCKLPSADVISSPQKLSDPSDFWLAWCKVQCHNGQGGAACNCDLAPLSIQMTKEKNIIK